MKGLAFLALSVAWAVAPPNLDRAEQLYSLGDYSATEAAISAVWQQLPETSRPDAMRFLRKIAFRRGDEDEALNLAAGEVNGRLNTGCTDQTCLRRLCDAIESGWYISHERSVDYVRAAQWYARYRQHCVPISQERSRALYIAGIIALGEMRLADAWADFAGAIRVAERPVDLANALTVLVGLAARLGRTATVQRASDAFMATEDKTMMTLGDRIEQNRLRAAHLNNIGWSLLLLREAGHDAGDPTKFLLPALEIVESPGPNFDPRRADNFRINLALAAVQRGDVGAADPFLQSVDEFRLNLEELYWFRMVKVRISAVRGDIRGAIRMLRTLDSFAGTRSRVEMRWQVAHLRGLVLESFGALHEAITVYQKAERLLDVLAVPSALGQGRDHYIHALQRSARHLIGLQVRLGRDRDALCTLRSARARVHRGLLADITTSPGFHARRREAIDDGLHRCRAELSREVRATCLERLERERRQLRLTLDTTATLGPENASLCEALPSPLSGEVFLAYVRLDDGWVGVAADAAGVTVRHLGEVVLGNSPEILARTLLHPFTETIARATRLRILATETLHWIDFHMLPWNGEPLLIHAPVAYGLDLPAQATTSRDLRRAAVVVADPTALLRVQQEAHIVRAVLDASGLGVELLAGAEAVRGELIPLLGSQLSHLYIGGHAGVVQPTRHQESSWLEPEDLWDVVLHLEENTVVAVEDVLAEVAPGGAPDVAVLMACKTGITDSGTLSGGIGMAQALLLRGSGAVIGTQKDISDTVAHALTVTLYEGWDPSTPFDATEELARAQAVLWRQGFHEEEIGKARVWVR